MTITSTTYRIQGRTLNQNLIVDIRGKLAGVSGIGYVGFDLFADGTQHMILKHKDNEQPDFAEVQAAVAKSGPYTLTELTTQRH